MANQPDQPTQASPVSSDKLVLPAPPGQEPDGQTDTGLTRPASPISPASSPAPHGFLPLIRSFWQQSPFRVLGLAIALVLAASIVLVALGASTMLHSTSSHPTQAQSTGQTPAPSTSAHALTVQITDISDSVENGTTAQVQVQTSEPGASVKLQVTYRGSAFFSTNSSQLTDNAGQATINWPVNISSFGGKVHATVTIVATDQNGQQATSDPMTVTITNPHQKGNGNQGNDN